jgi:vanillate O-demethylase monooxygenase subunit
VISGDNLACGYHGLQFDASGRCVQVPGQEQVARGARVRSPCTSDRTQFGFGWATRLWQVPRKFRR